MSLEYLKFNISNDRFEFSDDIHISGCGSFCELSGSYYGLSGDYISHRDDTSNPHEVTFDQARDQQGGSDVTLAELEELTDGSVTVLHAHAGGGADTLDNVCDRGNETNQDIHSSGTVYADRSLMTDGDVEIADDLNVGDDASISGDLHVVGTFYTDGEIHAGNSIFATGDLKATNNLYLNSNNDNQDAVVHFYKPTAGEETLRWDKTDLRFEFSDDLQVQGKLLVDNSGTFETGLFSKDDVYFSRDLYIEEDILCEWDAYIKSLILNKNFHNTTAQIIFRKPTSGFESLTWNKGTNRFLLSNDLQIQGDLYIDESGTFGDQVVVDASGIYYEANDQHTHISDFLAGLPGLMFNTSSEKWQYCNDGSTWADIGSGGAGAGSILLPVEGAALGDGTVGSAAPALSLVTTSDADDPQCRTFCLRFDASTDEHCFWQFRLPADYSSGGRLKVQFYNVSAQLNDIKTAQFEGCLQAVTPGDATIMTALDLTTDGGGWVGTLKTLTSGTTAGRLYESSIDMASNLDGMVAGDFIQFGLRRDVSDDDATGDMAVIAVTFEYNYA